MTWESFYLICFLVGLILSAVSLLGGMGHFGGHVPHLSHGGHPAHLPQGNAALKGVQPGQTVPWWNFFSITVFLCWFGAAGYLLTRHGSFVAAVVLMLALGCGLAGGTIVFLFLTRVLMPHERELTADETDVVGAVGRLSAAIRSSGTGELLYEQMGAWRSVPARSETGEPISKQEEVFVVRYEQGIAYVRKWDEGLGAFRGSEQGLLKEEPGKR
jgi:membrane protein implicated in regulation of membrane protease activity